MLQDLNSAVAVPVERILKGTGSLRTDRRVKERVKPRQVSGTSSDVPLDNFSGDTLYVGDFSVGSEFSALRLDRVTC